MLPPRRHKEDKEVEPDVEHNERQLECCKFPRLVLKPQAGKQYRLESVERHHDSHHGNVLGMCLVAHGHRDGTQQRQHHQHEDSSNRPHCPQGGGKHRLGIRTLLVGKIEKSRLHAEGQDYQQESRVGVDIGHHAVASRGGGDVVSVERNEQIVQKSAHNATQSIDDRVGKEFFQRCHNVKITSRNVKYCPPPKNTSQMQHNALPNSKVERITNYLPTPYQLLPW